MSAPADELELCDECNKKMDQLMGTNAAGVPGDIPRFEMTAELANLVADFVDECPTCSAALRATGGSLRPV